MGSLPPPKPPGPRKIIPFPGTMANDPPKGEADELEDDAEPWDPDAEVDAAKAHLARAYVNRGARFVHGDWRRALEEFDLALEVDPACAAAWYQRGIALRWDDEEALTAYRNALEIDPSFADAYLARGSHHADFERYGRALADLNRAVQLRPETIEYRTRAEVLGALGRHQEAYDDLTRAARRTSDPRRELFERVQVLRRMGDEAATEVELLRLIDAYPDSDAFRRELAFLRLRTGDFADAWKIADEIIARERDADEFAFTLRADAAIRGGRLDHAIADLSRAIELSPVSQIVALRASVHELAGRFDDALADLDRVLVDASLAVEYRLRRARLLQARGDRASLVTAFGDIAICIGREPNIACHYAERARVLAKLRRFAAARAAIARATAFFRRRESQRYAMRIGHVLLARHAEAGLDLRLPKPLTREDCRDIRRSLTLR